MSVEVSCIQCQKQFLVKPYQADSRKFCSQQCKNAHHRLTLTCEKCGNPFWVFKSAVEYQSKRFCSMACRMAVMGKKETPKKERVRIVKVCKTCAREFVVPKSRKDTATYCSHKCKGEDAAFRLKCALPQLGEKSAAWKGGETITSQGYLKVRSGFLGGRADIFSHRSILAAEMVRLEPSHSFLINVDGKVRIDPAVHVHHIDRDRKNNAIDNLLAVTAAAHRRIHANGTKPHPWECWPPNPSKW